MSTLREQMLADLQLKGLTPKTQKIYLREVRNFAKYFSKSPEQLGEKELREYLLYLLNERKLSEGTYRFYYSGLKFLYRHKLNRFSSFHPDADVSRRRGSGYFPPVRP